MTDRQLFRETFSQLHASEDTITEVMKMAREQDNKKRMRHPARTGALIALAAVLLMGSAFAAVTYHLRTEPVGDLAVAVSIAAEGSVPGEGEAPGAVAFSGETTGAEFMGLNVTPGWLPEGMVPVAGETTKWCFEDNYARGGFSLMYSPLNAGNATFCDVVPDAESQESLTVNGHEAIYVKMSGDGGFNQRMYVSYPEYNAVMTIYIGADAAGDEAVRFAENLAVAEGDTKMSAENLEYNGKIYLDYANLIATGVYVNTADEDVTDVTPEDMTALEAEWWERNPANRAAKSGMADAHEIGESFPVTFIDFEGAAGPEDMFVDLDVKVTDITVRDDVSALRDPEYLDPYITELLDDNGKLPTADYSFVVYGDGVNTPSVTTAATLPDQQLYMVAATVEITNNTDRTIRDANYNGRLLSVAKTAQGWAVTKPEPDDPAVEYDEGRSEKYAGLEEMRYWDLRQPDSNGGNQIADLAPGETVTIQMGFVVSECQLGDLWFYMNDADIEGPDEIHVGYVRVPEN